jgi:peroxiredoxin
LEDADKRRYIHRQARRLICFARTFTLACSETHLPGYENLHGELVEQGIDSVACLAVNDAFVMHQWVFSLNIQKTFMLQEGNNETNYFQ